MLSQMKIANKAFITITTLVVMLQGFVAYEVPANASENTIVVVVNENNPTNAMSSREIRKLFLGKSRKLPDGSRALLVSNEQLQSMFNKSALRKADSQVKAAWSRLQFSGRAKPPVEFYNPIDVVKFVADNRNAIGYVRLSEIGAGVKPVYSLK